MLLRLCSHHTRRNMNGIDEMISILGLPETMLFRFKGESRYLNDPWEIDAPVNIPVSIRSVCEPVEITVDLPKERNEVTGVLQSPTDKITILGVRIRMDNNPGKELWAKIERLIEAATPNDKKIPFPKPVAPNQKEAFFLEAGDIPVVDLRPAKAPETVTVSTATVAVIPDIPVKAPETFQCAVCQKSFGQQRGLWMHERKMRHKAKEPVAA
jgi:hypothetical protein